MSNRSDIPSGNHERSVIICCATSLELGLIQLHSVFNQSVPDCGRLLFSGADHPNKCTNESFKSSPSVGDNASPLEVQSKIVPDVTATEVNQHVTHMGQDKNKLMQCQAPVPTVLQDRKCQKMKNVNMQLQEPKCCVM